jgi:hypothetical protein
MAMAEMIRFMGKMAGIFSTPTMRPALKAMMRLPAIS